MERYRRKNIMGAPIDKETGILMKALEGTLMKLLPKRMERRGVR